MLYLVMFLELLIIVFLIIYIEKIKGKGIEIKKTKDNIEELKVTRDLITIAGSNNSFKTKCEKINKYILKSLGLDFSTIVLKDGNDFEILETNVDLKKRIKIKEYHLNDVFKEAVNNKKIVHLKENKLNLEYLETDEKIKTAMFLPIVIDGNFSGYWLIESFEENKIDEININVLINIKETMTEIIKIGFHQSAFENLIDIDKFSNFKTREYLFSEGKNKLDKYDKSTIAMIEISNLETINEKYNRETGNQIITKISETILENIEKDDIVVRYMGPKFILAIPKVDLIDDKKKKNVEDKLNKLKDNIEKIELKRKLIFKVKPEIKIVYGEYFKNTRMDKLTRNLETSLKEKKNIDDIYNI